MKPLRHFIEYAGFRTVIFLLDTLPYRLACSVARGAANIWWLIDRKRQKVAKENILRSGLETDPEKALAMAKRATQHMALVIIESLRSSDFLSVDDPSEHIELDIKPDVQAALADPDSGLIIASGHIGNWEVAGHWVSQFKPVAGITRAMNNPLIEKHVKARKAQYRFRPIPKHDANTGRFLEVLDSKEVLALLFDQHAGAQGMMIDFFGHPAATFKTAALLHLVTRVPLCFASCTRTGPMKFEISTSHLINQPRSGKKNEDLAAILRFLNLNLESAIRKAPDQYLWGHRRWRD